MACCESREVRAIDKSLSSLSTSFLFCHGSWCNVRHVAYDSAVRLYSVSYDRILHVCGTRELKRAARVLAANKVHQCHRPYVHLGLSEHKVLKADVVDIRPYHTEPQSSTKTVLG